MKSPPADSVASWWALSEPDLLKVLDATAGGLSTAEAARRLTETGPNTLAGHVTPMWLQLLVSRFTSPLVLILIVAAGVSLAVRQWLDAWIVLGIVVLTAVLSFVQEYRAAAAVQALRQRVAVSAQVLRDGGMQKLPVESIVPGDIVELSAGSLVPADARVLEARDCYVSQAMLTGESLPVAKQPGECPGGASLAQRDNSVFMGTSVRSGWARAIVVETGMRTVFGGIAERLRRRPLETEFELGLRRLGNFLVRLMLTVVIVVLAANIVLHRPMIDTLLFAAALAVGLSPELLPAILTVTLSHGARAMAREGVIVKRLNAIENLGSMDVLCTDKTGTLTNGVIALDAAIDPDGSPSKEVLHFAAMNAVMQAGIHNALDDAIKERATADGIDVQATEKIGEIPFDFQRRRLGVVARLDGGDAVLVTKGAVANVLDACTRVSTEAGDATMDDARKADATARFIAWSEQGYRVLALARRRVDVRDHYDARDEADMTLLGFLLFFDAPDPQVAATLAGLQALGVQVKIVTGDNRYVARHVARSIGMPVQEEMTGEALRQLNNDALWHRASKTTLFAEIEPNQKERIIAALRHAGHVVGFLGDGINDAPALHAADVGISVDTAVDVAKDAADFVLLRHDLDVIRKGVDEGRRTFANTIKYIFIATSGNFGNMLSMAAASLFLPFLPLLAKQILLNNFLGDVPSLGIATDRVDDEWRSTPHRWDIGLIRRAMLTFGLTSSAFDLITFVTLFSLAGASEETFRTGWFVESLLTELWVLLVLRTYRPFFRSRPGRILLASALLMTFVALALPYSVVASWFGLVALSWTTVGAVTLIAVLFVATCEVIKRPVYRHLTDVGYGRPPGPPP